MVKLLKILLLFISVISVQVLAASKNSSEIIVKPKDEKYFVEEESVSLYQVFAKELKEIEKYLNSFQTMICKFKQSSHGDINYGKFLVSKPGKVRYEYFEPSPIIIIVDNDNLTYYDKELDEVSYSSADINAIKLLALSNLNFKELDVTAMEKTAHFINICIKETSKELKQDLYMTLKFTYPQIELKQINISTDEHEDNDIDIILGDITYNPVLNKELFYLQRNKIRARK